MNEVDADQEENFMDQCHSFFCQGFLTKCVLAATIGVVSYFIMFKFEWNQPSMDENLVEILQEKYLIALLIMISVYGLKRLFQHKTEVEPSHTAKNGIIT